MPIDFPPSPASEDTYSYGGKTYRWNGTYWTAVSQYATADVTISATPPVSPTLNQLWLDIS
jgi:hypothetical protein